MRNALLTIVAIVGLSTVAQAQLMLITPVAAGGAYGSSYFPMNNGFDGQPTTVDPGTGQPVEMINANDAPYYYDRYGYVDFGPDFADIRIYSGWTLYRPWSGGDQHPYQSVEWTSVDPTVSPGAIGDPGNIAESTINFNTGVGLPNQGDMQWIQDFDASSSPITPQARYLLMGFGSAVTGQTNNRAEEYAFVGEIVSLIVGDMNDDGVIDNLDINPFVQALTDPTGYQTAFGLDPNEVGDINDDGVLDNLDINPFVALLTGGPSSASAVPEPASLALIGLGGLALLRRRR